MTPAKNSCLITGSTLQVVFGLIVFSIVLFWSSPVFATENTGVVAELIRGFSDHTQNWVSKLQAPVKSIFIGFFTLELAMLGITAVIKRSAIEDIFSELIMSVLVGAFLLVCILNYSEWSEAIFLGLAQLTSALGIDSMSIMLQPLDLGLRIFDHIIENCSIWKPADALANVLFAAAILVCFAMISLQVIYVQCEGMVAVAAGFILLGFGGYKMFRDYTMNLFRYIISVGFKLFVLLAVIGLGFSFIQEKIKLTNNISLQDMAVMFITALILYALTKSLPDVAAGIINGAQVNTGGAMSQAVMQVAAITTAAAIAGAGVASNARAAAELAKAQGATGIGGVLGGTIKNMASAYSQVRNDSGNASTSRKMGCKLEMMRVRPKKPEGGE